MKLKYSLVVSSKIPLAGSAALGRPAYLLGQQIAAKGHVLLTPVQLSLAYRTAVGASDKAGLSIGFSPAANFREHVRELQLPDDVYDWLCFAGRSHPGGLLAGILASSQALILIGGVMANLSELALASEALMPVGILIDAEKPANNDLLQYLQSLPLERQKHIVVHKDPQTLLATVIHMLDAGYDDIKENDLAANGRFFKQLVENGGKLQD